jgi:hypothetical protein
VERFQEYIMRNLTHYAHATGGVGAEQKYQQYMQISQSARATALRARRETVHTFWTAFGHALQHMLHHAPAKVARDHYAPVPHGAEA